MEEEGEVVDEKDKEILKEENKCSNSEEEEGELKPDVEE